jgi:hypothetical protein
MFQLLLLLLLLLLLAVAMPHAALLLGQLVGWQLQDFAAARLVLVVFRAVCDVLVLVGGC